MQVPSSDGVTVALHDLGGSGEPLLLAHATGFCGRAYEPLARLLAGRFHVWALDFRSHGDSTAVDELHWHRIADDLEAAAGALGDGPLPVVGHSMGGACALLVESRRPGTFRWAYVYEPIVYPPSGGEGLDRIVESTKRRRAVFGSRAEAMERFAGQPPLDVVRADSLLSFVRHGMADVADGVRLKCAPEHEAAVFAGTGQIGFDDVRGADIPVVVAAGPVSHPAAQHSEAQVEALPRARLVRHDTLGHLGPLQEPNAVAAGILALAGA